MASKDDYCDECDVGFYNFAKKFHENKKESRKFLINHGILPTSTNCPKCGGKCSYRESKHSWRCMKKYYMPKTKKWKVCGYQISEYKGTFLTDTKLPTWKFVLYINHFLHQIWDYKAVLERIQITLGTNIVLR